MNISIESENFYYKKGLELLIPKLLSDKINENDFLLAIFPPKKNELINITFRDAVISVNIFNKKNHNCKIDIPEQKFTIHIPFICKNRSLTDIIWTIKKIIQIANINNSEFINDEFYRITGLKKHEQLSLTETKIMLLIGKGCNIKSISKHLHRSAKTIHVHCRNASRKMKVDNKVEFYNYAKFIVNCRRNERKTLCL